MVRNINSVRYFFYSFFIVLKYFRVRFEIWYRGDEGAREIRS